MSWGRVRYHLPQFLLSLGPIVNRVQRPHFDRGGPLHGGRRQEPRRGAENAQSGADGLGHEDDAGAGPINVVNIDSDGSHAVWKQWVANSVNVERTHHALDGGAHTTEFSRMDPGVRLQKLMGDTDSQPSVGPSESQYVIPQTSTEPPVSSADASLCGFVLLTSCGEGSAVVQFPLRLM